MRDTQSPHIPAAYLILFKENKTLLLKRKNTGYQDGNYSLIAGHVEPNESFTESMIREAKEEAGITLSSKDLQVVHLMHRKSSSPSNNQRIDLFFLANNWQGEITNIEPHKCEELAWFDLNDLPSNIIPYVNEALHHVIHQKFYSEKGWNLSLEKALS
ncbi:MAG TPA: NUDIX domain-containing protein [Chlamydiales bacterium]|nr:NUDIX domain-containing protein [Chlamydiales bacterium]